MADGTVLGDFKPRHRHQEWIDFLKTIDKTFPNLKLHIVCDNYATHKHERIQKWLKRNPRFHIHFTPTSGSWLNLVERWFRDLTQKCVRRGSFNNFAELYSVIWDYIEHTNDAAKPFIWKAKPDEILAKVARARACKSRSR